MSGGCGASNTDGSACLLPADEDAGLGLCAAHLLAAHDWVARDVGVTDVLPSPCLACGSRLGVRYPSGWLCGICEWRVGDIPDEAAPPPRVDVVYYIWFRDRIKIGTSATPRSRIAALPCDRVLAFERGARALEQRRHREFADDRIGTGEWFRPSDALLAHIGELAAGVDDPWDAYAAWVSTALALRG